MKKDEMREIFKNVPNMINNDQHNNYGGTENE